MSYLIENENITISNMIAEKIYELMPTIPFVSSSLVNYNEQKTRITIDHPQPYELIADAIKEIVNELNTFLAQIKKLPIDQQTYVP
jgi:DNA-directed RNA polymerase subunit L